MTIGGAPVTLAGGAAANVVSVAGTQITETDRSGTITAGGVAQVFAAANTSRAGFWIQNQSTGDLWLSAIGTAAATQPSLKISAGALYEVPKSGVPTAALSIFGATTGQGFAAREW